jgi:hypothetical protein
MATTVIAGARSEVVPLICFSNIALEPIEIEIFKSGRTMSKIPGSEETIEMLVNCKTYPAISKKYIETVCTGGVRHDGTFVRLYPVPFRFLNKEEQYERWDIIQVKAYRDTKDQRPESWHLAGSIKIIKSATTKKQQWAWMKKAIYPSRAAMEDKKLTNGCVEIEPLQFYWKADSKKWTEKQLGVINQRDLFIPHEKMPLATDKVPFEFRLRYREKSTGIEDDNKVLAWSYYEGFRKFRRDYGSDAKALEAVHKKVAESIFNSENKVFGIFGTHSRIGIWMVSALYHVPKTILEKDKSQGELF